MGMLFHYSSEFISILVFFFLGSFCFLHFRHKTWMYDTIRFYQGFTIFNHYILSVGLCLCVWILLQYVCVQVCAWEWACACVCACPCVWVCLQVSVYMCVCACVCVWQGCRYSTFYFVLFSLPLSCFVPLTVFILSSIFKTWSFLLPSLWYLLWYSFLHKPSAVLFWTSAIQRKCCIPSLW